MLNFQVTLTFDQCAQTSVGTGANLVALVRCIVWPRTEVLFVNYDAYNYHTHEVQLQPLIVLANLTSFATGTTLSLLKSSAQSQRVSCHIAMHQNETNRLLVSTVSSNNKQYKNEYASIDLHSLQLRLNSSN
jgi:hypothetical protein